MQAQSLQLSSQGNDFKYGLVKSYGHKHNHELSQFKKVKEILESNLSKARLLGNVKVGRTGLDALLLTPQALIILEFKDYEGMVEINGQHEFLVYDKNGNRKKDIHGNPLVVEGGSFSDPFEQAKANRRFVKNSLQACFGANNPISQIPVYLIIIFNSRMIVNGIERFNEDLGWFSIMDMDNFLSCVKYRMEKGKGISVENQDIFIKYLDANRNVLPQIDIFEEAQQLLEMNAYANALLLVEKCDALDKKVIDLTLRLYYLTNDRRFKAKAAECLCCQDEELAARANELIGLAYYKGTNGFYRNQEKAMIHLKKAGPHFNRSDIKESFEISRRLNENDLMSYLHEQKELLGTFFSSLLMILLVIGIVSIFLPFNWIVSFGILTAGTSYLVFGTNLKENLRNSNFFSCLWSKNKHKYYINFTTCKVNSKEFNNVAGRSIYILNWIGFFLLKILFFSVSLRLFANLLELTWIDNSFSFLNRYFQINFRNCLLTFTIGYLAVNLLCYILLAYGHLKHEALTTYPKSGEGEVSYSLGVPKIFTGWKPSKGFGFHMLREAISFGFVVTTIIGLILWLKPFLYHWLGFQ